MKPNIYHAALALIFLVTVGCNRELRPEGMPKLYPVTITITQEDRPVENALVNLYPENESRARWGAGGLTDSEGKAVLSTHGKYRGVAAGNYRATVLVMEREPSAFVGEITPDRQVEFDRAERARKAYHLADPIYADLEKSDLLLDVKEGRNEKTFDLGKPVRILINTP